MYPVLPLEMSQAAAEMILCLVTAIGTFLGIALSLVRG